MRQLKLIGECNRCGRCCVAENGYTCANLLTVGKIGEPGNTVCKVYDRRYNGMPIILFAPDFKTFMRGQCAKDSDEEIHGILSRGIGKGCSMTIKEERVCDTSAG